MLPVDEVQIELLRMSDIGLGKTSLYTKKQLNELAVFQESQGTRRAELAYNGGLLWGPRHNRWNEFYSHVKLQWPLRFLHVAAADGMRRIPAHHLSLRAAIVMRY
jgi:hypothetical protein